MGREDSAGVGFDFDLYPVYIREIGGIRYDRLGRRPVGILDEDAENEDVMRRELCNVWNNEVLSTDEGASRRWRAEIEERDTANDVVDSKGGINGSIWPAKDECEVCAAHREVEEDSGCEVCLSILHEDGRL